MAWLRALGIVAALAAAAILPACGSQPVTGASGAHSSSAARSPGPSAPGTSAPSPSPPGARGSSPPAPGRGRPGPAVVVRLSAGFSPGTVRLRAGQRFLLIVSSNVQATGLAGPGACPPGTARPVAGGLLTAQCMAGDRYLYTANRAGTATVTATVKPRCSPGTACPQWVTEPSLTVMIS